MKISSVSKKVLASALSAAMVVAFAPTVALATGGTAVDPAKYVSVTFDANGSSAPAPGPAYKQVMQYDGKYYIAAGDDFNGKADGYSFDKWFIDADGDGVIDEGEAYAKVVDEATMIEISADATSVVLKAAYQTPVVDKLADSAFAINQTYADDTAYKDTTASKISFHVTHDGQKDHKYVLSVTNPTGTVVATETFGPNAAAGESNPNTLEGDKAIFFTDNALSSDKWAAYKSNLVAGDYTVTLTDNGKEISTQKITLAAITVKVGSKTKTGLGQVKGTADLTAINPIADTGYQAYTDAEGYYVANTVNVKGDATYTAVEQATTIKVAPAYNETNRQLTFEVYAGDDGAKYDVTVKAPSGVVYTGHADGEYTIDFNQTSKADRTSAAEEAGDYIVTATITEANGTVKTASAKFTLTELKVEAGEGTKVVTANKANVKSYFTDDTTEADLATFVGTVKAAVNPGTNEGADNAIVAKDAHATLAWKLNGADIVSANKVKAGQTNTLTATTAAVNYAAAPEYSVSKVAVTGKDDQYVLSVTPASGTTVVVKDQDDNTIDKASDGKYNVTNATSVVITATGAAGTTQKVITLEQLGTTMSTAWKNATQGGQSALEKNIGNTTTKWLAADGVKAAIASGKASIDAYEAKYYAVATEGEAIKVAAYKALYGAVAAEADAQIKAYENGAKVIAGSKVYSMTADQYAAAVKAVDTAKKDVETAVKNAGTNSADIVNAYKAGFDATTDSVLTVANTKLTDDANGCITVENYAAADVKAAQKVSASLKAATTGAEAEAALKAFDALTAAQKELVAAADLAAAQKVADEAKAQAELKVAQDDAAVSKARSASKTVKAGKNGKTTKKQSVTLKKITSASGAKVTYKKSSGSSKISVKSGKAYLAKGVKKGTYKATVKATCGTQTAKIKVTFKVK